MGQLKMCCYLSMVENENMFFKRKRGMSVNMEVVFTVALV